MFQNPRPARPPPPKRNKGMGGVSPPSPLRTGPSSPRQPGKPSPPQRPGATSSPSHIRALPKPSLPVARPLPSQHSVAVNQPSAISEQNQSNLGSVQGELQSKFGVKLKKSGITSPISAKKSAPQSAAPGTAKGAVPKAALQPKVASGNLNPSQAVIQSLAGRNRQDAEILEQQQSDSLPECDHFYANVSDEENDGIGRTRAKDHGIQSTQSKPISSPAGGALSKTSPKKPPYINIDVPADDTESVLFKAKAMYDFQKTDDSEMDLKTGQKIEVLKNDVNGWSYIRSQNGHVGWSPSNYLERLEDDSDDERDYENDPFLESRPVPPSRGAKNVDFGGNKSQNNSGTFAQDLARKVALKPTVIAGGAQNGKPSISSKPDPPGKPKPGFKPAVSLKPTGLTGSKPGLTKPNVPVGKPQPPLKPKPGIAKKPALGTSAVQKLTQSFEK